jgi:hypothetical protein
MTRTLPKTARVSDTEVLIALEANGGHISNTAKQLRIRKSRVVAINRTAGNPAADKNRKTVLEAVEGAVLHVCAVIETVTIHTAKDAHRLAILLGVAVDKLVALADKQNATQQRPSSGTPMFDITRVTRDELHELYRLHDKINGIEPPEELSDLDNPVCYDDDSPDGLRPAEAVAG